MKPQVIKDLAAILVENYYQNNSNNVGGGGSLIANIILQLAEVRQDIDLQLIVDSENLIVRNDEDASLFLHEYKQSELPDGADQSTVKFFVEQILRDFVYKV